ncbi:LysR family transcriptional regulator [Pseudonocardia sp. CA-107938]|uniref:LysR family transcriptional regulator n=1 Tax=Pseudonocardia sp. CA-107938 TaxID=3240021 RepID=UPI003D930DE9
MELRQLTYFEAVVAHGGFGRAAQHLRIAQPAVSTQVRKLESELGVTLLRRTTRRVELTRAGELFLAKVRAVQDELAAARTDLALLAGGDIGRVRIGAIQALDPFDLSSSLAAFHRRHPDVELVLRPGRVAALLDALDHDHIDLAICPLPGELPEHVTAAHLFTDELVLITAPEHPTATAGALPITALRDEPFVCLPPASGLRARLEQLAADAGFTPRIPFESASLPQLRDLVAHGLGVALLARSVAEAPGRPVAVHQVDPGPVLRPVGLLHRTDRPLVPAAQACRAFLLRSAGAHRRPPHAS